MVASRPRRPLSSAIPDGLSISPRRSTIRTFCTPKPITIKRQLISTTVGRVLLNEQLPETMPFTNGLLRKKGQTQLVNYCYLRFGLETTVQMLDAVKDLGFLYATKAGISIGVDDLIVPLDKQALVHRAEKDVMDVEKAIPGGAPSRMENATTR